MINISNEEKCYICHSMSRVENVIFVEPECIYYCEACYNEYMIEDDTNCIGGEE